MIGLSRTDARLFRYSTRAMTFPPLKDIRFSGRDVLRQFPKKSCHEQRGGARPLRGVNHEMGSGKKSTDKERMDVTGSGWIFSAAFACVKKGIGSLPVWAQSEHVSE
jgi:hypothetical protein